MKKICLIMAVLSALHGCYLPRHPATQFRKMTEATGGARARMRVVSEQLVRATSGRDCMDWKNPASGVALGGQPGAMGSTGYRGRVIAGMPDPRLRRKGKSFAEFYLRADEPVTLMMTPDPSKACALAITFVPEAGHDYEYVVSLDRVEPDMTEKEKKERCGAMVMDISGGNLNPVEIRKTFACAK